MRNLWRSWKKQWRFWKGPANKHNLNNYNYFYIKLLFSKFKIFQYFCSFFRLRPPFKLAAARIRPLSFLHVKFSVYVTITAQFFLRSLKQNAIFAAPENFDFESYRIYKDIFVNFREILQWIKQNFDKISNGSKTFRILGNFQKVV